LAGIVLAKKCFWLYSALLAPDHCVPVLSSIACKLQEFPVVFIYLHSLALPLAFAIQMALGRCCGKGGKNGGGKDDDDDDGIRKKKEIPAKGR
jgi:hypothetical protein